MGYSNGFTIKSESLSSGKRNMVGWFSDGPVGRGRELHVFIVVFLYIGFAFRPRGQQK